MRGNPTCMCPNNGLSPSGIDGFVTCIPIGIGIIASKFMLKFKFAASTLNEVMCTVARA